MLQIWYTLLKLTFRHRAPNIRIFCEHNRIICEIACFKTKTILDKDIIVIFKDIDNGDENTKVLVMWQKNKNQDIYAWTNFLCF